MGSVSQKIEQPNQCGATSTKSVSLTSKLEIYIHVFGGKKLLKKIQCPKLFIGICSIRLKVSCCFFNKKRLSLNIYKNLGLLASKLGMKISVFDQAWEAVFNSNKVYHSEQQKLLAVLISEITFYF